MTIHREGYPTILLVGSILLVLNFFTWKYLPEASSWIGYLFSLLSAGFFIFILSFFRIPSRIKTLDDSLLIAPADGKVVVIEEVRDEEYFNGEKRLQVSIFMSPLNVHVNLNPLNGEVVYSRYHPGKFLVAWHPKSSTENERHSVVIKKGENQILIKQIAGALARRIVNYLNVGDRVSQGKELGFIKFGSRVDILLPPGTQVLVDLNQNVKGGVTPIARI
jgi:phosphatidylserine decarboxylase